MAEKRMFAKTIIDSDAFLDMPLSAQALYFHLSMRADDEGFVNNPKKIQRIIGAADDDIRLLFAKKFILVFETGVIVIKHWKLHNCIRADRLKTSVYTDERNKLYLDENNSYTLNETNKKLTESYKKKNKKELPEPYDYSQVSDIGQSNDSQVSDIGQQNDGIDKTRLEENRLDKVSLGKTSRDKEEYEKSSSSNEEEFKNLKLYEKLGFGGVHSTSAKNIKDLEEQYSEAWVEKALLEADYKGKRNLDYVQGILKNWKVTGIKKSKDKDNSSSNNQSSYRNPKPTEVFNSQMYEEFNPNEEIPDYDTVYRETCERMRRKREAEYKKKQITT